MKFKTEYLTFHTSKRREYINITDKVAAAVAACGAREGMVLLHHEVILPITNGRLDLGPWQQVFYAEFDGQRPKRLVIKVMGE